MTRRPPSIVGAFPTSDGGFEVKWEVDTFFSDSADPEKVLISLNGVPFQELDGDETSVEVPVESITALAAQSVVVSVSFWWAGTPPEEQQSVIAVPVQTGHVGGGNTGVLPAAKPAVTLLHVQPRTLYTTASIEIGWQSNNYNDGNIFWGPAGAPTRFRRSIRPVGEVYSGTFMTDRALTPATHYFFKVEVRNTLHSPNWISTTIVVRSASATVSVRQFLMTSNAAVTSSLAGLVGSARSVRKMLLG